MPGYVARALKKFQHPTPKQPCYSPHPVKPIQYGKKIQLAEPTITSHQASKERQQSSQLAMLFHVPNPKRLLTPHKIKWKSFFKW